MITNFDIRDHFTITGFMYYLGYWNIFIFLNVGWSPLRVFLGLKPVIWGLFPGFLGLNG